MSAPTRVLAGLSVRQYLDAVGSQAPAPGAGSVAALTAALAAGLNEKVARHAKEAPLRRLAMTMGRTRQRLLKLVDEDAHSYQAVVAARKAVPAVRRRAFIAATKIPLTICADSAMIGDVANRLALHVKGSIKADAVAAEALAGAALEAARLMVEANLPFVDDAEFVTSARKTLEQYTQACCNP